VGLDAEQLFKRYFLPLYPPDVRADLRRVRTEDTNPAGNVEIIKQLEGIAATFAKLAPTALDAQELDLDFSDASVHRLAAALTRKACDRLVKPIKEQGEVPPLVQVVTHGAVYVAACIVKNHGATWQVRNPLWESLVRLESRAGTGDLAVFQWWLKSLSDEEIDEPRLSDRYFLNVEVPTKEPEILPVIAPADRRLPRLKKVRYDTLYKHLRAHLPELASVGDHFTSPERFAELAFEWLELQLVGDGRMLLMHGPSERGVHLFWLDNDGFTASAFFPADAAPAHEVVVDDQKLRVTVHVLGSEQHHEMLWWGPSA
jgi:hypothetical protein